MKLLEFKMKIRANKKKAKTWADIIDFKEELEGLVIMGSSLRLTFNKCK